MKPGNLSRAMPVGLVIAFGAAAALAHGGATGIVAERMDGMMMLGEQTKLLTEHFSGSVPVDVYSLANAAQMISDHSGSALTEKFPEGSLDAPSEAREVIWDEWAIFLQYAEELQVLADELEQALIAPAAPLEEVPAPEPDEWEELNIEVLLGLKSREELAQELQEATGEPEPELRSPEVIFADITRNCGGCHERFRL